MITREDFIVALNWIHTKEERERNVEQALANWLGDENRYMIHESNYPILIVDLLAHAMTDDKADQEWIKDDICWWLWDSANFGESEEGLRTIYVDDGKKRRVVAIIKNTGELYDYLIKTYGEKHNG